LYFFNPTFNEMKKFIFPEYCRIEKATDFINEDKVELFDNNYLLFNKKTKNIFTINESMKNFLEFFKIASDFESFKINFFSESLNDDIKIAENFFNLMVKNYFLIENDDDSKENESNININEDNFEIIEILKETKNEFVVLCKEKLNGEAIVLKGLKKNISKNQKRIKFFNNEFEILSNLKHENICNVVKVDFDEKIAVLEYIKGITLKNRIKDNDLEFNELLFIIKQILNVFEYIHNLGFLHGDVHAGQFIVNENNFIKLIDFGLGVNLKNEDENKNIVRNGGVHYYLEPENINSNAFNNLKEYVPTVKMEIYRLGVLFYFILYKKYPFESISWFELCKKIKNEAVKFPIATNYNNEVINNVIVRCLNKNPLKRFNSINEIKEKLNFNYEN